MGMAFAFFQAAALYAGVIKEIKIVGNANVATDTILSELQFKVGSQYDEYTADAILKRLNETTYFDDITVEIQNDVVIIKVAENPVINKIAYEGMNYEMKDVLKKIIKVKPRQILFKPSIQETQQIILEAYRSQGYLSARVSPKIIRLPNNRVNVAFEVHEGSVTYVRRITFIGNKCATSNELRGLLSIREKRPYHISFLGGTKDKVYDAHKFTEDQQMLVRYYLSQGYADFEIVSATAELSPDKKDFFLTYYLKEGDVYHVGEVTVDLKIAKLKKELFEAALMIKKGEKFNGEGITFCSNFIKSLATAAGYNFATVEPVLTKNPETKTVDIKFVIKDGPKIFIEKIDIKGNRVTRDRVIRREIGFSEGDAFDQSNFKPAEERIKSTGFFKGVRIGAQEGTAPDSAIVTVDVEEDKVSSITGKFGYSTLDKLAMQFGVSNPNYSGKGQALDFSFSYAKRVMEGMVSLVDPYFMGRRLVGGIEVSCVRSKVLTDVTQTQAGITPSLAYRLSRHVSQHWSYRLHRDSVKSLLSSELAAQQTNQSQNEFTEWLKNTDEGRKHAEFIASHNSTGVDWGSAITHALSYDTRNRRFLPSQGYYVSWSTTVSGLGGSIRNMVNTWTASWHHKVYADLVVAIRQTFICAGGIGGKQLRHVDSLFLGGDSLRGFEHLGVSPVRGECKERSLAAIDHFLDNYQGLSYFTDDQKAFLTTNKDSVRKFLSAEKVQNFDELAFIKILAAAIKNNNIGISQYNQTKAIAGKQLGGTRCYKASIEFTYPISDRLGLYARAFTDCGAVWRSKRLDGQDKTSVVGDDFFLRVAIGASISWKSPFGMITFGYARPLRKHDTDSESRWLFGVGTAF
ncbi:MAG: outer membrane protein assembly factor BamA [Holosporales bacterium]|nr:outer membrane protein assembly factor BamA [Holosporales bacterium]